MTDHDRDALLLELRERLVALEALPADVEDLRTKVDNQGRMIEALRADMNAHGHTMRREFDELKNDLPGAVVEAVERSFGAELRSLRADVDALKAAG